MDIWCSKHPAWVPIAYIPSADCEGYYVQWAELSRTRQEYWGSEYGYNEFATKKCKIETGFVTGNGVFHDSYDFMGTGQNACMVFKVGRQRAKELMAIEMAYHDAISAWLRDNPEWMKSRDFSGEGRRRIYVQWAELTPEQQALWSSEQQYQNSGASRCKVEVGYLCPTGFFSSYRDLPQEPDARNEVVFRVGTDHAPYRAAQGA